MKPLVTIAIPTLGRIEYLRQALASALAQTYSPIEVLVGDNAVEPSARRAIASMVTENPSVRILTQKIRLPMAAHWNALADAATGRFFVLLADDDLLEPEFVGRMIDLEQRSPEAKVLFSDHWIIDEKNTIDLDQTEFYSRENGRIGLKSGLLEDSPKVVWSGSVPVCSSMIETALVRKYRFNESLNTPELEFFVRVVADGVRLAYRPERLARYRVHANSETQSVGLRNDRLFLALKELPTPASAEGARKHLLENLLVTAVSNAYHAQNMGTVRKLLGEVLYPHSIGSRPVALLQRFCARLPDRIAPIAFKSLYASLRKVRRPKAVSKSERR